MQRHHRGVVPTKATAITQYKLTSRDLCHALMVFLQSRSNPDKLEFWLFGGDNDKLDLWQPDSVPDNAMVQGVYLINRNGTFYDETIVIGHNGQILYLPEKHPNDPIGTILVEAFGIFHFENLAEFRNFFVKS